MISAWILVVCFFIAGLRMIINIDSISYNYGGLAGGVMVVTALTCLALGGWGLYLLGAVCGRGF